MQKEIIKITAEISKIETRKIIEKNQQNQKVGILNESSKLANLLLEWSKKTKTQITKIKNEKEDICNIVIGNKYPFGLHPGSWHRPPKTFGISWVRRVIKVKGVSFVHKKPLQPHLNLLLGKPLRRERCWLPGEPPLCLRVGNFSLTSQLSERRERARGWVNHQWSMI